MFEVTETQIHALLSGALLDRIETLESFAVQMPQQEIPLKEGIREGMYVRQILIPAGTLLTGRVYKRPYVDVMLGGDITVGTPEGVMRLTGPHICDGSAGRKRAGYAHADTWWLTVHQTDSTKTDGLLEEISFFSVAEYLVWRDREDFTLMAAEMGVSEAEIRRQSENESDRRDVDMPLSVRGSQIEGMGLFADTDLSCGFECPARIGGFRTQAGRYTNHSKVPNAEMVRRGNDVFLVTTTDIAQGREITVNYRQARSTV